MTNASRQTLKYYVTPEKIASLYLRLNGFLQLPLFTLFYPDRYGQIDIIALRPGNSVEKAMGIEFIVAGTGASLATRGGDKRKSAS